MPSPERLDELFRPFEEAAKRRRLRQESRECARIVAEVREEIGNATGQAQRGWFGYMPPRRSPQKWSPGWLKSGCGTPVPASIRAWRSRQPGAMAVSAHSGGAFPESSPDGRELYYVSPDSNLMAVGLKPGADSLGPSAPRELFALPPSAFQPYAVAPDGKRFLVLTPVGGPQPGEVITNWPALLKSGAQRE